MMKREEMKDERDETMSFQPRATRGPMQFFDVSTS